MFYLLRNVQKRQLTTDNTCARDEHGCFGCGFLVEEFVCDCPCGVGIRAVYVVYMYFVAIHFVLLICRCL